MTERRESGRKIQKDIAMSKPFPYHFRNRSKLSPTTHTRINEELPMGLRPKIQHIQVRKGQKK